MTTSINVHVPCILVGEYVDEAELPANSTSQLATVQPPEVFADHLATSGPIKEFTVLMKDGRMLAVKGHTLIHSPHPTVGQDLYSIVVRRAGEETVVALFKSADVAGIFHGELRADRQTA